MPFLGGFNRAAQGGQQFSGARAGCGRVVSGDGGIILRSQRLDVFRILRRQRGQFLRVPHRAREGLVAGLRRRSAAGLAVARHRDVDLQIGGEAGGGDLIVGKARVAVLPPPQVHVRLRQLAEIQDSVR